jgi:lipopolysaccharide transport system ATP-binding protein
MSEPAISVRNLSKCYQLGAIGRHTLVDEAQYWWHKLRGRDPREHFSTVGHSVTEARKIEAERAGADQFWALQNVSFDVEPGTVIGIIGRNGAGKSTLLKILTRITEPTSGEAVINGRVASLLEVGTGFHPELTGRENIYMNGTILGMKRREIAAKFDEIVAFSELDKFIDTPVKRYSSGMYVRLAFAVAAHLEPEILLVDEVLAVGDAEFQNKCLGKMQDFSGQGRTVLFVSHNMGAVKALCSHGVYLKNGTVDFLGSATEVVDRYLDDTVKRARGVDIAQRKDRKGSGIVRVTKMDMFFDLSRGAWVIEVGYTSGLSAWGNAGLLVSIRRTTGELLTFLDSSSIPALANQWPGNGVVTVQLSPDIRLTPGHYVCNVACRRGGEIIDHVEDAFDLQVHDVALFDWQKQPASAGLCFVRQNWTIRSS